MLPKEFIFYTNNHVLSFLNSQDKLSYKYMKWVKQLQAFKFSIKHKKGTTNKVAEALSRRITLVEEVQMQSMGINALRNLYKDDLNFGEIHKVYSILSDA